MRLHRQHPEPLPLPPEEANLVKKDKGVALILAIFATLILGFLAFEYTKDIQVDYVVAKAQYERLQAYYLAKSGVNLSVMKIFIYKQALARFGQQLGENKTQLEMIWKLPMVWPLDALKALGKIDSKEVDKVSKKSLIKGEFSAFTDPEGGKIDINDLASPSEALQKSVSEQILRILENKIEEDRDFADRNRDLRPQELINNIADWIDEDKNSKNGGDESSGYQSDAYKYPPTNRPLKTLEELHMVKGMTDEIYELLAPRLTVFGIKGINVNSAEAIVIRSIDKNITDELVQKVLKRRKDPDQGPFKNEDDLKNFLSQEGMNVQKFNQEPKVPLYFDSEYNFKIKSVGRINSRAQRQIVAIVFDFDKVKSNLAGQMATPAPSVTPPPTTDPGGGAAPPQPSPSPSGDGGGIQAPSGPPSIVYWQEF